MKVYPLIRKTLLMIIATSLFVGILLFLLLMNMFLFEKWDWRQWTIIGAYLFSVLLLSTLLPLNIYYEVNRKYVEVTRFGKKMVYQYSDVVYIDEEKSLKKKTVMFYTNKGHARYLSFDRKGLLFKTMLANCKNRLSEEEFARKYPNVKL